MNYRIRWPLAEALWGMLRGTNSRYWWYRNSIYMWGYSTLFAGLGGGFVGSVLCAFFSAESQMPHDILVISHGIRAGFWIYLGFLTPLLFCASMELLMVSAPMVRGLRMAAKMSIPRIERIPVDRTIVEKYERGEI